MTDGVESWVSFLDLSTAAISFRTGRSLHLIYLVTLEQFPMLTTWNDKGHHSCVKASVLSEQSQSHVSAHVCIASSWIAACICTQRMRPTYEP